MSELYPTETQASGVATAAAAADPPAGQVGPASGAAAATTTTATTASKDAPPKIVIYWLNKSRSHRIVWLLEELGLPYELKVFMRGKNMLAPEELKQIHPLGKSPVMTIQAAGMAEPLVVAESGNIVEYLAEHFGRQLIPQQWQSGKEHAVGGETEQWLRYRYLMHYAEASLTALLVLCLVIMQIKNAPVPFFVKPILRIIGSQVEKQFLNRNLDANFGFVEGMLSAAPAGDFFCGNGLTGADVMMIFPLEAAIAGKLLDPAKYPKCKAFVERVHAREAYKAAIKKGEEVSGEKFTMEY